MKQWSMKCVNDQIWLRSDGPRNVETLAHINGHMEATWTLIPTCTTHIHMAYMYINLYGALERVPLPLTFPWNSFSNSLFLVWATKDCTWPEMMAHKILYTWRDTILCIKSYEYCYVPNPHNHTVNALPDTLVGGMHRARLAVFSPLHCLHPWLSPALWLWACCWISATILMFRQGDYSFTYTPSWMRPVLKNMITRYISDGSEYNICVKYYTLCVVSVQYMVLRIKRELV